MSSVWPGAFDSPPTTHVDDIGETVKSADINNLAAIVKALEVTLGLHPELGGLPAGLFTNVVSRLDALDNPAVNYQNNVSNYTLVIADMTRVINMFSTTLTTMTITIPPHSAVPFPLGASILVRMAGTAAVNFAAGAGVTLNSRGAASQIAGQYGYAQLLQVQSLDHWDLTGDVM